MVGRRFDYLLFYQISSRLYHPFRISCAVEGRILSGIHSKGSFPAPHVLDYESYLDFRRGYSWLCYIIDAA